MKTQEEKDYKECESCRQEVDSCMCQPCEGCGVITAPDRYCMECEVLCYDCCKHENEGAVC